ncbi:putative OB-fold protein [Bradyrhizobium diazoefficiens]
MPTTQLRLCKSCLQYVFPKTRDCPHCGSDASIASQAYREGNLGALESMLRVELALEKIALNQLAGRRGPGS